MVETERLRAGAASSAADVEADKSFTWNNPAARRVHAARLGQIDLWLGAVSAMVSCASSDACDHCRIAHDRTGREVGHAKSAT